MAALTDVGSEFDDNDDIVFNSMTLEEFRDEQEHDPDIRRLKELLEKHGVEKSDAKEISPESEEVRAYCTL